MSASRGSPATDNSRDASASDRDQRAESAVRAHDVAEHAEEAAQRPVADGDRPAEPLTTRDNQPLGDTADGNEKRRRTAERAYFKSEQRGFSPGYEEADWLEAEREIDRE